MNELENREVNEHDLTVFNKFKKEIKKMDQMEVKVNRKQGIERVGYFINQDSLNRFYTQSINILSNNRGVVSGNNNSTSVNAIIELEGTT